MSIPPSAMHVWVDGHGIELEPGKSVDDCVGVFCAMWDGWPKRWCYYCFNGHHWAHVPTDSLPPGFRAYLLIVGVT